MTVTIFLIVVGLSKTIKGPETPCLLVAAVLTQSTLINKPTSETSCVSDAVPMGMVRDLKNGKFTEPDENRLRQEIWNINKWTEASHSWSMTAGWSDWTLVLGLFSEGENWGCHCGRTIDKSRPREVINSMTRQSRTHVQYAHKWLLILLNTPLKSLKLPHLTLTDKFFSSTSTRSQDFHLASKFIQDNIEISPKATFFKFTYKTILPINPMGHQASSRDYKSKTREQSPSRQAASQTFRYVPATVDSAAPYISPYPRTTGSFSDSRETSLVKESACSVSSSSHSSPAHGSSIYSSAGAMSSSNTISVVCENLAHRWSPVSHFIIFIVAPDMHISKCPFFISSGPIV